MTSMKIVLQNKLRIATLFTLFMVMLSALVSGCGNHQEASNGTGNSSASVANVSDQERKQRADAVRELAAKSGGDFNRLSPEDQERLQKLTAGRGAEVLRATAAHFAAH